MPEGMILSPQAYSLGVTSSCVHFLGVFDLHLYPLINLCLLINPLIDLYPVIGENTLASHSSDGFLNFLICVCG